MSFLNQLRQQAQVKQTGQTRQSEDLARQGELTESACRSAWTYLTELARQLNVLEPPTGPLSLDGRTPWPAMRQFQFRCDNRKKTWRDREVFDYLAMGWSFGPVEGAPPKGRVTVNFPPDLERVEQRLKAGSIRHERIEQRHPETQKLQALHFEHEFGGRSSLVLVPDHDAARVQIRLVAVNALEISQTVVEASRLDTRCLDELAKRIVGQPSQFS